MEQHRNFMSLLIFLGCLASSYAIALADTSIYLRVFIIVAILFVGAVLIVGVRSSGRF